MRRMINLRALWVLVALLLLAAGCGGGAEEPAGAAPATTAPAATASPADEPAPTATEAPTTAPPPAEEEGDGVGSATVTISDESWSFDQVALCTTTPQQDETVSFVMIIQQDDWQLVAKIIDPSGERGLGGEGVYSTIDFQFVPDPTQGVWLASGEATGEQFLVVDGLSVTATTDFEDLRTNEVVAGTVDATCP